MSTHEPTMGERLIGVVPKTYREEMARIARMVRDRLPPVVIEHRIDALERHLDRRFKEVDAKLEELMRRVGSRAA
jgi:hypothetical protein